MKFNKDFFQENQSTLLKLANSPIGGVVRRSLGIQDNTHLLTLISPESHHYLLPDGKRRATIYLDNRHSTALHRNYQPLWEAIHAWDMRFANRYVPAWNMGFDTYTSQPDATAGLDTYIRDTLATTNFGTNQSVVVGHDANNYRTLIKFDFSTIPSNATATAPSSNQVFSLWQSTAPSATSTFSVYRQKKAWTEAGATWNKYDGTNNWTTAGGFDAADCETSAIASLSLTGGGANGEKQWVNFDLTLLQNMWDGTFTNNGFLIRTAETASDSCNLRSSDWTTAGERPKMVIVYSLGSSGNSVAVSPFFMF